MGKTTGERLKAHRAKRATEGLRRYEFWLRPEHVEAVKRLIERLVKGRKV